MPDPLFGRPVAATDEFAEAVSSLLSEDAPLRALARNLMHDHRVSESRATLLRQFAGSLRGRNAVETAVNEYFRRRVRTASSPDFLDDGINGHNILAGMRLGGHVISKDLEIGRTLDLSGLQALYIWARERDEPEFATLPDPPREFERWLDTKMSRPIGEIEEFLGRVLPLLREYQLIRPFEPCWATTWAGLEPALDEGANRWLELVGVHPGDGGRWVIVLRYKVRDVGTLVRPTQLDAGWYCFHFPSPPVTPLSSGGHPMDVGDASRTAGRLKLIPEYIHEQIGHNVDHWRAAGRRFAKTKAPEAMPLGMQRMRHWSLLRDEYSLPEGRWMPAPA